MKNCGKIINWKKTLNFLGYDSILMIVTMISRYNSILIQATNQTQALAQVSIATE
ncbi:conserved protein of unknown function [Candidatus Nitrosocosmicus franklandus]|uniref:Uncharacterized protein n=1 Tax=Candidatus Nitrosocosmicus franklandianus TaxID=1798806 RepID=A0A484IAT3_9ARCH|nr:conserved protein of unknown function [Candidatus Nitrosocosmicus franklandus]